MELWDLYDENRLPTGETHVRQVECTIPQGRYHLVVQVWVRNAKGEYVISQRAADRPTYPLFRETTGGSVLAGEDSLRGALREAKEEVGIDLDPEKGKLLFTMKRDVINGRPFRDFVDVWLFDYDGELDLAKAETKEVAEVKWMTREEIRALDEAGVFVPTLRYFFDRVP